MVEEKTFLEEWAAWFTVDNEIAITLILLGMSLVMIPAACLYLKTGFWKSLSFAVAAFVIGFTILLSETQGIDETHFVIIAMADLIILLAARMYIKWIGGGLTEQEQLPGMEGIRAWLNAGNMLVCLGIAFCAWVCTEIPDFEAALIALPVTVGVLLVYPLGNTLFSHFRSEKSAEDLTTAQVKVLELLEQGKISPAECGELLSALRSRKASEEEQTESTTHP
ncbi:MAG: hypothetical protein ACE15F_11305 [bacterium]